MEQAADEVIISYIALGSNLGDTVQHVQQAIWQISQLPNLQLIKYSNLLQTKALLPADDPSPQPDYINAAICVATTYSPQQLLQQLHAIEHLHGRERSGKWKPRTLDLDILLYGDLQLNTPELTIPHPEMHKRDFVLIPLKEIKK